MELAAERSKAHLADVAMSLTNRSEFLIALDRYEEAFVAAEEALRLLTPFWQQNPEGYDSLMASLRQDYETAARGAGRRVDGELWRASAGGEEEL